MTSVKKAKKTYPLFTILLLGLAISFFESSKLFVYAKQKSVQKDFELIVLHTNDIHAHDLPFKEKGHYVGGLSAIAYLVSSIKSNNANVLVIDAGDFFQGTPLFQRYGGSTEIHALNAIGYDAVELGNHEFDKGAKYLADHLKEASFPVLACNLDCSTLPSLQNMIKPGIIKNINGERIALIGVITPDLEKKALGLDGVKVKIPSGDWMQPIKEEVDYYLNQGINKIILVSHCGIELDKAIAEAIPSIDLIIGGHSHTRLPQPLWVAHANGIYTAIVQTGCYARALGEMYIKFDSDGHILKDKTNYHLINIVSSIPKDPDLENYLEAKEKPLAELANTIIGVCDGDFWNHFANIPTDSAIGDLICDAMFEAVSQLGVEITLQNRGGIRAKLEKGPISEEKIQEILPFDNKIVCATVSGDMLRSLFEYSLSGPHYGAFLDVHGLKIAYDPDSSIGKRIISISVQDKSGSFLPLQPKASYRIAINDYNFKGGDGYDFSGATNIQYSDIKLSDTLNAYILKHQHVRPRFGHRLMPKPSRLNLSAISGTNESIGFCRHG